MPCKHIGGGGAEIKGHSFLTLAPDVLGCRRHTPCTLHLGQEAGWPSGPVSMGMEKPRSDTDSNPETSSHSELLYRMELGWLRILVNNTSDNCHNSIITLGKVVLRNKQTVYQST